MFIYEMLPEKYKILYSREACDQLVISVNNIIIAFERIKETISEVWQGIEPITAKFAKIYIEYQEFFDKTIEIYKMRKDFKNQLYKPRIKLFEIFKENIYYHIRNNC